jgi:hypothetical protein
MNETYLSKLTKPRNPIEPAMAEPISLKRSKRYLGIPRQLDQDLSEVSKLLRCRSIRWLMMETALSPPTVKL